ncbi:hypothetical protein D3C77_567280 [compost metagenome]
MNPVNLSVVIPGNVNGEVCMLHNERVWGVGRIRLKAHNVYGAVGSTIFRGTACGNRTVVTEKRPVVSIGKFCGDALHGDFGGGHPQLN